MITQLPEESIRPLNSTKTVVPRPGRHRRPMTAPKPQTDKASKRKKVLLIVLAVVVLLGILVTTAYFIKQLIDSKYFFCKHSVKFIPLDKACNGINDCTGGEDEMTCVSSFKVNTTFPVRLMSAQHILQVYSPNSGWRSVCGDDWTQQHTQTAKPHSTDIPVNTLISSLNTGPFTAVRPGTTTTPIHQATIDRECLFFLPNSPVCRSGSVISLSCSDCGDVGNQGRIVGGTDAFIENWPWQTHTSSSLSSFGACSSKKELSRWTVVSGRTYMGTLGGSSVDRVILNADYNPARNDYDIALMRLSSPISVGVSRRPVCLPPKDFGLPAEAIMVVTGWGYLEEAGKVSPSLQKASIPLIDQAKCSSPSVYGSSITPRMICAGFLEGKVDACQGDSGGPLVHFKSSHWHLIGVVSWGVGCAREKRPGVYCNVEEMLNWIYTVIEVQHREGPPSTGGQ
ncbi:hypothetical protein L3Q82_018809 [Scortum barcoo]|uniref:Uncharacterized protein n=1 Tax=Scortum barcoo TaxID=214431 RepID=A0ACB8VFB6_9TELE|nr:hypothetical protein L3Q82_018809 [Scortum barcoo]